MSAFKSHCFYILCPKSQTGVRQGDSLSRTLFDIYVNDICNLFDASCDPMTFNPFHINCMFYGDDLVLLSKTKIGLQHFLDRLKDFTMTMIGTWR